MNNFLDQIKACVQAKVKTMQVDAEAPIPAPDFCELFTDGISPVVIAEIKFHSPSRGAIYKGHLSAVQIAREYRKHGASALSIVTEPHFFKGHVQTIRDVKDHLPDCPVLLKDFIVSPVQIRQAKAVGASAVLLIAGFLDPENLSALYDYTLSHGLTPLVEVHNAEELDAALALSPKIIGINNRNLKTLTLDLNVSRTLIQQIPEEVLVICESGINSAKDIKTMLNLGCDGFLIGSHLMQYDHPGNALDTLFKGVNDAR